MGRYAVGSLLAGVCVASLGWPYLDLAPAHRHADALINATVTGMRNRMPEYQCSVVPTPLCFHDVSPDA